MAEISDNTLRPLDVIVPEFTATYKKLVIKLEKKARTDVDIANLDRLRKRVALLREYKGKDALIKRASKFFVEYGDRILEPDPIIREQFFLSIDVKGEYVRRKHRQPSAKTMFAFELTESIKNHFRRSTAAEKAELYEDIKVLLQLCIEYRIYRCNMKAVKK